MPKRTYKYYTAPGTICGLMRCGACHQEITTGQYRCYVNGADEFRGHLHRTCSSSDANWAILDEIEETRKKEENSFIASCVAFQARWGIDDLDCYIKESEK